MTQDTEDDLLAQVFSVMPTIEGQVEHSKEEQEIDFNVRRVSNAFQEFIERSGVVETATHERHTESHFHVETHVESHREVHHETHREVVISGGIQVHQHHAEIGHEATHIETHPAIGLGATIEHHEESHVIGEGAAIEHHEESHDLGHGVSVTSAEMNPPEEHHVYHEEQHFGIGQGAVPHAAHDDVESVVSVGTEVSDATSVSVHSSVSQKSVQIFADAPVIVKVSSRHSDASHKSSVVPESHHSEVAHTHDRESAISMNSGKSSSSTLTGSDASKNTAIEQYVFVEKPDSHHHHHHEHHHEIHHSKTASHDSTPIAPVKSEPLDALIEEFKLRHQKAPSEVSSVVHHAGVPPPPPTVPPPAESDNESDVVTTMKVTQYEFDSDDVKHSVEHHREHHEHHGKHNGHELHHVADHVVLRYEEPPHEHETFAHNGFDSHIGHGATVHHGSDDGFNFEHVEYHDTHHRDQHHEHQQVIHKPPSVVHSEPRNEVPAAFFHSPVIQRKAPPREEHFHDSGSDTSSHRHHHIHHHHSHEHGEHHVHRELIPNVTGPHVREDLRPVTVVEEHVHVTTVKPVSAPVAHVSPVISHHEKGLRRIDESQFISIVGAHDEEHHHSHGLHRHHHSHEHHHHSHHGEKHYHKHDDQLEEVFSGPSVKDLKSRFEQGGEVKVHYGTHYISHHKHTSSAPVHVEHELHYVEQKHDEDHHIHERHHHHHEEMHQHHHNHEVAPVVIVAQGVQPRLPHRESKEGQVITGQTHKHHHHYHHEGKEHHHHHHEGKEHHHLQGTKEQQVVHKHHHHHSHGASVQNEHKHIGEHHNHKQHHHNETPKPHREHEHHHHHGHHSHNETHAVEQVVSHKEAEHHHREHDSHNHHHHEHTSVEEGQLPVSELLLRYGGGSRFRRPDHVEEIKIYSRSSSVPNIVEHHREHLEEHHKPRTVTQSTVTSVGNQSQSAYSVQSNHRRSHSSTVNHEHHNHVKAAPVLSPIAVAAPVAAARSTSADHQSLRVVKSVRAFVSEWGQKDFVPPMSPIITVPRLPSNPSSPVAQTFPLPATRKTTVMSSASSTTNQSYSEEHKAIQKIEQALRDDESVCSECSRHKKRPSVASVATTVTTTHTVASHHQGPVHHHIGEGVYTQVPEVHEEFVLTPLAERRAIFEQGLDRGYSINRKTRGELRPMVNVFTD